VLAYVFWHWRRADVPVDVYERRQTAFHEALASTPPEGFQSSLCLRMAGAPWAHHGGRAYEDWYFVQDGGALDALNDAAITGRRRTPHDAAAEASAGGTAAVYKVRLGAPIPTAQHALWFAKPEGMSYEELWSTLAPLVQRSLGMLASRYMVLGPSPELSLHTPEPLALPQAFTPLGIALQTVWPRAQ
jgi:hypothetical protein